jgi:hypothetical protein
MYSGAIGMASTINTSIVKLDLSLTVVYLSKPMVMRINPYVGYQGSGA